MPVATAGGSLMLLHDALSTGRSIKGSDEVPLTNGSILADYRSGTMRCFLMFMHLNA